MHEEGGGGKIVCTLPHNLNLYMICHSGFGVQKKLASCPYNGNVVKDQNHDDVEMKTDYFVLIVNSRPLCDI